MIQYILFDLDNTLYPRSLGIFEMVVERIWQYMERMGFEKEDAQEIRHEYVKKYGSTLRGLMIHYHVDPEDYLDYVHDVGVETKLHPNPSLAKFLQSIPIKKAIFTSSHRPHTLKVLSCLGVEEHFSSIFDISFSNYIPKPNPEPYQQVLKALSVPGENCMMVEDVAINLQTAKELRMTTVLISQASDKTDSFIDYQIKDVLELADVLNRIKR